jgi:deoxyribose-phosphate aldolase
MGKIREYAMFLKTSTGKASKGSAQRSLLTIAHSYDLGLGASGIIRLCPHSHPGFLRYLTQCLY